MEDFFFIYLKTAGFAGVCSCGSSCSLGLEQGSMELVLDGCTGDVREVLVLRRRRTGGGLYLLLLCWLLAAHPTAHGKWGGKLNLRFLLPSHSVRARMCVRACLLALVAAY